MRVALNDSDPPSASPVDSSRHRVAGAPEVNDVLSALPTAIYTTDAAGRITFYNAAAAQLWGYQPELGSSTFCGSWKLYWPDGRPMRHDECPMAVVLQTGKPLRSIEAVAERPDGTRGPFVAYPTPLYGAAGNLVGAVNMLIDVTERKAFEASVRCEAQLFQMLNGVAQVDSDDLDVSRIRQVATDIAVHASGARFGAFVHKMLNKHGQGHSLHALAPMHSPDGLAIARNRTLVDATLREGKVVRCDDIRCDERYVADASSRGPSDTAAEVVSYLAVPVRRLAKVHGALLLGYPDPGIFTQETENIVTGIA